MLTLGPYEILIIVSAILLLMFGPVLAGLVLAFVRRFRRRRRASQQGNAGLPDPDPKKGNR